MRGNTREGRYGVIVERYRIIPKGNSRFYLCEDIIRQGLKWQDKSKPLNIGIVAVIFEDKEAAEAYIASHFDEPGAYEAEAFLKEV